MNRRLAHLLNWTWCLPQTLVGLFWYIMVKHFLDKYSRDIGMWRGVRVTVYRHLNGGVSLGPFFRVCTIDSGGRDRKSVV